MFQRGVNLCDIEMNAMTTTASTGDPTVTPGTPYNFKWQSASNGQVVMAQCSYWGYDGFAIPNEIKSADDCGGICAALTDCTYFSWWGNNCYLKASGMTHHPILADALRFARVSKCGYVVNNQRKSVSPWTTEYQFKVASNCAFPVLGYSTSMATSDVSLCKSSCLKSDRCNYFTMRNGRCYMMFAPPDMLSPAPISSSQSTCGYLSTVTLAPTDFKLDPPLPPPPGL